MEYCPFTIAREKFKCSTSWFCNWVSAFSAKSTVLEKTLFSTPSSQEEVVDTAVKSCCSIWATCVSAPPPAFVETCTGKRTLPNQYLPATHVRRNKYQKGDNLSGHFFNRLSEAVIESLQRGVIGFGVSFKHWPSWCYTSSSRKHLQTNRGQPKTH